MTVAAREASARVPVQAVAQLPVVVIGAGPVGLAAAAHLKDRGLPAVVLEAGERVGAAMSQWGHIRTFTPWQYIVDATAEKLLAPTGWTRPAERQSPTGAEIVERYLVPLAAALGDAVRTGTRVLAVSREGLDRSRSVGREERPFVVRVRRADGSVEDLRARAVIDASGTWGQLQPARRLRAAGPGGGAGRCGRVPHRPAAGRPGRRQGQVRGAHHPGGRHGPLGGEHPCRTGAAGPRGPGHPHRVGHPRHQRTPRIRRWHGRPAPRPRTPRLRPCRPRRHRGGAVPRGVLHPRAAPCGGRQHGDSRG